MYLQNIKSIKQYLMDIYQRHKWIKHKQNVKYTTHRVTVLVDKIVYVLHSRDEVLNDSNNKQQLIQSLAKHFTGD